MEATGTPIVGPSARLEVLIFELAEQRMALPVAFVVEISRACAVRPVPGLPAFVLGLLSLHGRVAPVLDLRARMALPATPLSVEDCFVFVRVAGQVLGLRVDRALCIESLTVLAAPALSDLPAALERGGVSLGADGVILIYDPERFLSDSERIDLSAALTLSESEADS